MTEWVEMTEDEQNEFEAMLDDPSKISTREKAQEIIEILDQEIAAITAQLDVAQLEAHYTPLSEERAAWARRATYARAVKYAQKNRVVRRDKQIGGIRGYTPPSGKKTPEAIIARNERQKAEVEARREAKRIHGQVRIAEFQTKQMELKNARMRAIQFEQIASKMIPRELFDEIKRQAEIQVQIAKENLT